MDRRTAILISMGFEVVGAVLAGVYVGQWLDDKYHWGGLGLVGMIAVGFIGWFLHLIIIVRGLEASDSSGDTKGQ